MRSMRKFFIASSALAVALLTCVYGTTFNVIAQSTQSEPSAFTVGSEIHCFSIPEDQQDSTCWVYNSGNNTIGFYHPNGQGPSAFWSIEDFQGMSASDDGHMAIVVTTHTVEVYTLLRKTPGRLSGITTPRTALKIVRNDVNFLAASVAENQLQILIEGKEKPEIVVLNQTPVPVETHTFNKRVFLPYAESDKCTPPECIRGEAIPTIRPNWPTPVVVWPTDYPCQGLSSDPPWCANRTPEPPPGGPRDTPEPILP